MATEKRLIDANAPIKKLEERRNLFIDAWQGFAYLSPSDKARVDEIDTCIAEIINAPTVDAVEVVHSWWEKSAEGYKICHHCKADVAIFSGHKNYCPNCGADMRGDNK